MHNANDIAYQNWIFSQEEPDLAITQGNGKRYKPVTNGIGDAQRMQDEFIAAHGQEEWERRNVNFNKFFAMTEADKDAANEKFLSEHGI